jgi:hypothetical protein
MKMIRLFFYTYLFFGGMCMFLICREVNTQNVKIMTDLWGWPVPRLRVQLAIY